MTSLKVKSIRTHPLHKSIPNPSVDSAAAFDIALVKVSSPISARPAMRSICLPLTADWNEDFKSNYGIVTGWNHFKEKSCNMQTAHVQVVAKDACTVRKGVEIFSEVKNLNTFFSKSRRN